MMYHEADHYLNGYAQPMFALSDLVQLIDQTTLYVARSKATPIKKTNMKQTTCCYGKWQLSVTVRLEAPKYMYYIPGPPFTNMV